MCRGSCWVLILGSVIFILLFLLIYFKKLVYNYYMMSHLPQKKDCKIDFLEGGQKELDGLVSVGIVGGVEKM